MKMVRTCVRWVFGRSGCGRHLRVGLIGKQPHSTYVKTAEGSGMPCRVGGELACYDGLCRGEVPRFAEHDIPAPMLHDVSSHRISRVFSYQRPYATATDMTKNTMLRIDPRVSLAWRCTPKASTMMTANPIAAQAVRKGKIPVA